MVGVRADGWTNVGECQWGYVRSTAALRRELDATVAAVPNQGGATNCRRLVVRELPKKLEQQAGERWHGLDDLHGQSVAPNG